MSFRAPTRVLGLAALSLLASACATAPALAGGDPDGILANLPTDAKPGVCYARVKTPATVSPPTPGHGRWVLSPPQPGAPGPLWCLVIDPGKAAEVISPEKFGWIRVLCDDQQTAERITGLQQRLHDGGLYAGEISGHYDEATASAVAVYQDRHHIDHGGYLSMTTVQAIEGAPSAEFEHSYQPQTIAGGGKPCCIAPIVPPPPAPVTTVKVPVYIRVPTPVRVPVPVPYPVYQPAPQPCCARAPAPSPCCGRGGPGAPATYAGSGVLSWPGKR